MAEEWGNIFCTGFDMRKLCIICLPSVLHCVVGLLSINHRLTHSDPPTRNRLKRTANKHLFPHLLSSPTRRAQGIEAEWMDRHSNSYACHWVAENKQRNLLWVCKNESPDCWNRKYNNREKVNNILVQLTFLPLNWEWDKGTRLGLHYYIFIVSPNTVQRDNVPCHAMVGSEKCSKGKSVRVLNDLCWGESVYFDLFLCCCWTWCGIIRSFCPSRKVWADILTVGIRFCKVPRVSITMRWLMGRTDGEGSGKSQVTFLRSWPLCWLNKISYCSAGKECGEQELPSQPAIHREIKAGSSRNIILGEWPFSYNLQTECWKGR